MTTGALLLMHVYALMSSQSLHETLDPFLAREAAEAELREILGDEPERYSAAQAHEARPLAR